ncbi:MAG: hypothetical protein GY719_32870 [bacterium]|nr:hypothetical protein [bacterium]
MTFDEYLESHRALAARRRWWIRSIFLLYGAFMVVYGAFFAGSSSQATLIVVMGGIFVAYALVISPAQFRYRVRRNWQRYPKIKEEFDITVGEEGIATIDDKGNPSHSDWSGFLGFRETENLFLVYRSPLLPLCLPKRLLADSDVAGFRRLLSSAMEPGSLA